MKKLHGILTDGFRRLAQSKQVPERDIKDEVLAELNEGLSWIDPMYNKKGIQIIKSIINDLSSNTIKIVVSSYDTGSSVPDYDSEEDGDYESFATMNNID